MEFEIREAEGMKAVCLEHIGPYDGIGAVFHRLGELASKHSIPVEGSKWLGVYRDDPEDTPAEKLRSAACVTVDDSVLPPAGTQAFLENFPGGRYLVAAHKGPYSTLGAAWAQVWGHFEKSGEKFRQNPCFELYLTCAASGLPEEQWITELWVPIQ